jgi:threonine aldolase
MAQRVREGLAKIPGVRFRSPAEINFVRVTLPQPVWDRLVSEG